MTYNFKLVQEVLWAAGVGAAVVALQIATTFDPDTITSWETWAIASGAAIARAAAAATLPKLLSLR